MNFKQINLVSDVPRGAKVLNADVQNAWGIVSIGSGNFWVTLNGTNKLALFNSKGVELTSANTPDGPTGLALLPKNHPGGGVLVLVSESGQIAEYVPSLLNPIVIKYSDVGPPGSVYKGCAIHDGKLYATNFNNFKVDIFNITTTPYTLIGTLTDTGLQSAGYSPFNVYSDRDRLFVTYALLDTVEMKDDVAGPGNGYINLFQGGDSIRLVNRGPLNSPWGMLRLKNKLYVGNFGDGFINVFQIEKYRYGDCCCAQMKAEYIGPIKNRFGTPIQIDGLWGIDRTCDYHNELRILFASGPDHENLGLIGFLSEVDTEC
jgi:uncharacterized protein (TIGR03118 family)